MTDNVDFPDNSDNVLHAANQELQFVLKRIGDIKLMTGNQNA